MRAERGWRRAKEALLDLLFPPRCAGCGRTGFWFCPACISEIERLEPPLCQTCGLPSWENPCPLCQAYPLAIDGIRGIGYLRGPLQRAIYRFKYKGLRPLAVPLAEIMYGYLLENPIPAEVLMPVSLHRSRLRKRGFNQAALLARELGKRSGIPTVEGTLVRVRETAPQVGLKASQRRENMKDAFRCADGEVEGKRVLLIDDVCTTGATLEACSLALRACGATSVWALVLARET